MSRIIHLKTKLKRDIFLHLNSIKSNSCFLDFSKSNFRIWSIDETQTTQQLYELSKSAFYYWKIEEEYAIPVDLLQLKTSIKIDTSEDIEFFIDILNGEKLFYIKQLDCVTNIPKYILSQQLRFQLFGEEKYQNKVEVSFSDFQRELIDIMSQSSSRIGIIVMTINNKTIRFGNDFRTSEALRINSNNVDINFSATYYVRLLSALNITSNIKSFGNSEINWTKQENKYFPQEIKQIVKTMLILNLKNEQTGKAKYKNLVSYLPKEILIEILMFVTIGTSILNGRKREIKDILEIYIPAPEQRLPLTFHIENFIDYTSEHLRMIDFSILSLRLIQ